MKFCWLFYALLFQGYTAFITSREPGLNNFQSTSLMKQHKRLIEWKGLPLSSQENTKIIAEGKKPSPSILPSGDAIDTKIFQLAFPALLNFAIGPLIGAVDTFWVGRMENAFALGGQGAANQLFSSAFWFFSFLPSVITPLIAQARGRDDTEGIRTRISEAIFIAFVMGLAGTALLGLFPHKVLSLVLKSDSHLPTWSYAQPYLTIRAVTFLPALLSTIGFAVFRGLQDVVTPLRISLWSNLINALLDPLFIFAPARLGVVGAAVATCIAEIVAFSLYAKELIQRKLLVPKKNANGDDHWFLWGLVHAPPLKSIVPLLIGGLTMQVRAFAINAALLGVTRATQRLDNKGTAAAAHAISAQLFQLGSIASLAMSTVASVMIPIEVSKATKERDESLLTNAKPDFTQARGVANRLLVWSFIVGIFLALLQLASLPLLSFFSPLAEIQEAAKLPSMIGAFLQLVNCFVWTGEGIQQGNQDFTSLAVATIFGTIGMLISLRFAGDSLAKVWGGFVVLSLVRLVGVLRYHFFTSPLISKEKKE